MAVGNGADQSFSIIPNQYYRVADVVVDGSSVGGVTTHTFESVDRDHTIAASFVAVNQPPVSNAGSDKSVLVSNTVQLDGSNSNDANGDSLTYNWSFVVKPGGSSAALSATAAVKPTFTADVAGTYTVQLIVNDGTVDSVADTVTISTQNSAPVSHAGADQKALVNFIVQLDGSASSDVDGDSLTFKWSLVSKPNGSSAMLTGTTVVKPTLDVDISGTYALQLIVNDGTVNSAPDTVAISTENSAPLGNAGADQAVLVNDAVQLDGSASSDADGDTLTFKWAIVSKPGGSSAVLSDIEAVRPTFTVDVAGTYTVQLMVNDGTDNSAPDTATIITENSAPVSHAGSDQTVEEGDVVTLSGLSSNDIDNNMASYAWKQKAGTLVEILNPDKAEATFIAPVAAGETENLTFELTVKDTQDLQDVDTCVVQVTKGAVADSDGDGVPDAQDAFPQDPNETTDTDGDGTGNNADDDDDDDGMPDAWEIVNNLDPLVNDAAGDPDGDGISNLEEYAAGTGPFTYEDHSVPDAPVLLTPMDDELVSLTPELTTDEFYNPDIDDAHAASQWQIFRVSDNFCVLDVTSPSSLTALKVPKLILEEDTGYSWKLRFKNNHDAASGWSDSGYFATDFAENDPNGNGIPDDQEVAADLDLDNDGVPDSEQTDIKCVDNNAEDVQIGVSIKGSENAASIVAMEIEDAGEAITSTKSKGKPKYAQLGLIHFKIRVNAPGDETVVTIHLSHKATEESILYKYDPVNAEWLDYSDYAEFSPNRKVVYLTLKDGGLGDADGIENGIIVDPLTVGTETPVDYSSGSGLNPVSAVEDIVKGILPKVGCFISTAVQQPEGGLNIWSEIRGRELTILFILLFFGYIGKSVFDSKKNCH